MASPPAEAWKIGAEEFSEIDRLCGAARKSSAMNSAAFGGRQGHGLTFRVVQVPSGGMKEPNRVINSRDAAAIYGGINIVTYTTNPS